MSKTKPTPIPWIQTQADADQWLRDHDALRRALTHLEAIEHAQQDLRVWEWLISPRLWIGALERWFVRRWLNRYMAHKTTQLKYARRAWAKGVLDPDTGEYAPQGLANVHREET